MVCLWIHYIDINCCFHAFDKNKDIIGIVGGVIVWVQLMFLVGSIVPTEIALRKNFDKNGNRR